MLDRSEIRLGDEVGSRTLPLAVFLVLEVTKERVDEWPAAVFSLTDEDVVLDR